MKTLDLYADPACPWSWLAVRWLTGVATERDVRFELRSFSLWKRDGGEQAVGAPPFIRDVAVATSKQSLRLLRVFEALRAAGREGEIAGLYLAWGSLVFRPGPPAAPGASVLEEAIAATGLEGSWSAAADDAQWDSAIDESMAKLSALSARSMATPVVPTLADVQTVVFRGAVLAAPVSAAEGLALWDAMETLTAEPAFVGLSSPPLIPSFA